MEGINEWMTYLDSPVLQKNVLKLLIMTQQIQDSIFNRVVKQWKQIIVGTLRTSHKKFNLKMYGRKIVAF